MSFDVFFSLSNGDKVALVNVPQDTIDTITQVFSDGNEVLALPYGAGQYFFTMSQVCLTTVRPHRPPAD